MENTSGATALHNKDDVTVTISLALYTDLVCLANDLDKIRAVVGTCKDDYVGSDGTRLIKALCGLPTGKE